MHKKAGALEGQVREWKEPPNLHNSGRTGNRAGPSSEVSDLPTEVPAIIWLRSKHLES